MLDLPQADPTPLATSPLELVVCQVRFEETLAVADGRAILSVHEDIGGKGGRFRKIEPVRGSQVQLGNFGVQIELPSPVQRVGWRLIDEEARWVATVMPDSVALETLQYSVWAEFEDILGQLLTAIENRVTPALEQRLGLRYVNRLAGLGEGPTAWEGKIAPPLLGPISHPVIGLGVTSTQQQIEVEVDESIRCLLRQGAVPDPSVSGASTYLIDLDIYRQSVEPYAAPGILEAASQFNDIALRIFQQCLTPEFLDELREGE